MGLEGEKYSAKELTKLAYVQLQRGNTRRAVDFFESAAKKAKGEGDISALVSCHLNAGACLISQGQLEHGVQFLQSALELVKTQLRANKDSRGGEKNTSTITTLSADIYYNLAIAAQDMNKTRKATSHFKASIDLYLKVGSLLHAAESFVCLANCYRRKEEVEKEVTCLVSAQQLYHDLGDVYHEASSCMELARTHLRHGETGQCREMLSTAKMLCHRVDDHKLQGKLYSQFGLLYISLGMFDVGVQNFEKALPLIREGPQTEEKLKLEASLLQNIGAAYNEQALFGEAIAYHREAAAIHGKVKNHSSESKCLCNLASAQAQLNQLQEAVKTFTNALTKASQAENNYLQFQACEGQGSVYLQMGRHGEARVAFERGLAILDEIREDTGIARERVREKMSEATEGFQEMMMVSSSSGSRGEHKREESGEDGNGGRADPNYEKRGSQHLPRRLDFEFAEAATTHQQHQTPQEEPKKLSITERRGARTLTPINASCGCDNPMLTSTTPDTRTGSGNNDEALPISSVRRGSEKPVTHKHAVLISKKGKGRITHDNDDDGDSYIAELNAYMESYRHSSSEVLSSSLESSQHNNRRPSSASPDNKGALLPQPPHTGATPTGLLPWQHYVREGSLAIGACARENFVVRVEEGKSDKKGRKRRHESEIIVPSPNNMVTTATKNTGGQSSAGMPPQSNQQQSRVCTIL